MVDLAGYVSVDLYEVEKRINELLQGVDRGDYIAVLEIWERYLAEKLTFPFKAEVAESDDGCGPLGVGDLLNVKKIEYADDKYGILVEVRHGRKKYFYPLCDLEVVDKKSANHEPVQDYVIYFSNR